MNDNKPNMLLIFGIVIFLFLADLLGIYLLIKYIEKLPQQKSPSSCRQKSEQKIEFDKTPNEMNQYMRDVQLSIKKNWEPPKSNISRHTTVLFKVNNNGDLLKYNISQSSGDTETDEAAINALKSSAPFKPFPKEFKEKTVDIQFTFDYNVHKTAN